MKSYPRIRITLSIKVKLEVKVEVEGAEVVEVVVEVERILMVDVGARRRGVRLIRKNKIVVEIIEIISLSILFV
jgi:hypothetical protein